jgi:hypothetical protein
MSITLLSLHDDILLEILKRTTAADVSDRITIANLLITCHRLHDIMHAHRETLEDAFTYPVRSWPGICYYFCGRRHRRDGPAEVQFGTAYYSLYGLWHRMQSIPTKCGEGDLPVIISDDGLRRTWYQRGLIHRDADLPADYKCYSWHWCKHGNRHRDAGPAIVKVIFTDYMATLCTCVSWDGYSDVSAADFDWRRVLAESDLVTCSPLIAIMYVWCINDETIRREQRTLKCTPAGAYVAGEIVG